MGRSAARGRALTAGAAAAMALATAVARAEPLPLRIDYHAAPGCPGEEVFLDEIRWRTALARTASPGEEALAVRARITRRGEVHEGRLSLGQGPSRVDRSIRGEVCDEVVSALALVTALAVDPGASTAARRPAPPAPMPLAAPAPAPAPPPSLPPTTPEAPQVAGSPVAPEIVALPLPVQPISEMVTPPPRPWSAGVGAWAAFAVTPRPLFGGAVFVDRGFGRRVRGLGGSVRLSLELGATGAFDAGPGRASFLRGAARLEGCAFRWAPASWLSLVPCLGVEGGVLHGQGVPGGALTSVQEATVPWAAAALLPRVTAELGALVLAVQGGPAFPLIRRTFVFHDPAYVIHEVPPVTAMVGVSGGVRFP